MALFTHFKLLIALILISSVFASQQTSEDISNDLPIQNFLLKLKRHLESNECEPFCPEGTMCSEGIYYCIERRLKI